MQATGNWHWYLLIGALALAGCYTFGLDEEPARPPEAAAVAAPERPSPIRTEPSSPPPALEPELLPAELTAIEAEQTFKRLEEEQQRQLMEMTPMPPDGAPEMKD